MKKKLSKKAIIIAVCAVVAVAIIVAVIAFMSKSKQEKQRQADLENIKWTVKELFVYSSPNQEDIQRIKENIKTFAQTPWMDAEFKKQGVAAIEKTDFGANYVPRMDCFWVKEDQLLLEQVGYNCPEFKNAYTQMLNKQFGKQEGYFGFVEVAKAVMEGPGDAEGMVYEQSLSYYSDPRSVFLKEYAPAFFGAEQEAAFSSKDTAALLELCQALSAMKVYGNVSDITDVTVILQYLTDGAEEITVRKGTGYYADETDSADTDYDYERYGPGNFVDASHRSEYYYGDLAYIFTSNDSGYRDDEGSYTAGTGKKHNEVYLKGTRISWEGIKEATIERAFEDGMVSYHKDGFCFAIGDREIVCFVGMDFYFEFA